MFSTSELARNEKVSLAESLVCLIQFNMKLPFLAFLTKAVVTHG